MREEVPIRLADEAAENLEAFYLRLVSWDQIIQWADGWILQLDRHPDALLEVSLSSKRQTEGEAALSDLARQSDETTVFPNLKRLWREALESERLNPLEVVERAWARRTHAGYGSGDWRYISRSQDLWEQLGGDHDEQQKAGEEELQKVL